MYQKGKIGVAVTTHNRHETANECLNSIEWAGGYDVLVVVDDASTKPFPRATFRFEENVGISVSKNKCLELLEDCEHIFLLDDDVIVKKQDWIQRYISVKQKHLCLTFQRDSSSVGKLHSIDGNAVMVNRLVRGCMLYLHHDCLEKVGGFDTEFLHYSMEHVELTNRIHSAGLTPYAYMDIPHALMALNPLDYREKIKTSVPGENRIFEVNNRVRLHSKIGDVSYCKYKDYDPLRPVILTAYFTLQKDPQRNEDWPKDGQGLTPLIESCEKLNIELKIFYDSIDSEYIKSKSSKNTEFIRIKPFTDFCTNTYRRIVFYEYLKYKKHPEAWMVDSTDVEVLKNPFGLKEGVLYSGYETRAVGNPWMWDQSKLLVGLDYYDVIKPVEAKKLPNAGLIGGKRNVLLEFLKKNTDIHKQYSKGLKQTTDMSVFNYTLWKWFSDRFEIGDHINTPFKRNIYTDALFKHK